MTTLNNKRVLLLDADGVLIRATGVSHDSIALLEDFLRDPAFADVVVVATGDWKRRLGLAGVRALFSRDVRARLVGVTPTSRSANAFREEREISAWLAAHPEIADYVVLAGGGQRGATPMPEGTMFVYPPQSVLDEYQLEALKRQFIGLAYQPAPRFFSRPARAGASGDRRSAGG
jgi:hypothetical protein